MKRISLFAFGMLLGILFCNIQSVVAVPAYPHPVTVKQPTGEELTIYIKGDEKVNWLESEDGYTLMYDDNKNIVYAQKDGKNNMIPSTIKAQNIDKRTNDVSQFLSSTPKKLRYSEAQTDVMLQLWKIEDEAIAKNALAPQATTGTAKAICALMEFSDKPFTFTRDEFDLLINQRGYENGYQKGSVRDFYLENSYGQLELVVTVVGPYTAANKHDYYGSRGSTLAREAADFAFNDPSVTPKDYDNDSNNYIDTFHFLFAGYGRESSGNSGDIWSHKSGFNRITYGTGDNAVWLNTYSCSPELRGSSGSDMTYIGVICHELCHVFGAPDFYDTNDETGGAFEGTGVWDLMAGGSWNGYGAKPAHINMYQKTIFGWVTPIELNSPTTVKDVPNSAENPVAYVIKTAYNREYYLLENRQQIGFDAGLPGHGLLIYHVSALNSTSNPNDTHPQRVYPVYCNRSTAIPNSSPASYGDISGNNASRTPYPSSGQYINREFTSTSTPQAFTWGNNVNNPQPLEGKPLKKITESNGLISFEFMDPISIDLRVGVVENRVTLRWTAPKNSDKEVKEYNVYRDGTLIYTTTETTFREEMNAGVYIYGVSIVFTDGSESTKEEVTATVTSVGIVDVTKDSAISVYPNPIALGNVLTVDLGDNLGKANLTFYDISGRRLFDVNADTQVMKVTIDLPKGIYILKINKDTEIKTVKFSVK